MVKSSMLPHACLGAVFWLFLWGWVSGWVGGWGGLVEVSRRPAPEKRKAVQVSRGGQGGGSHYRCLVNLMSMHDDRLFIGSY